MVNTNSTVVNGIIKTDKGNVTFYGENFKFTFMNADTKEEIVLDADENGYIWGRTYEGKVIAIYAKRSIKIKGTGQYDRVRASETYDISEAKRLSGDKDIVAGAY